MISRAMVSAAVLCAVAWPTGVEGNGIAWSQEIEQKAVAKQAQAISWEGVSQLFREAYRSYHRAKASDSLGVQSEAYADAIRDISKACALEPQNAESLLLAAQIYRSKGGSSYAKDYFSRAEKILRERMEAAPNDAHANLDYAIACLAGEGHFSEEYQKQGKKALAKVIRLCEPELTSRTPHGGLIRALGIAYLLKGETDKCESIFAKAATLGTTSKFYYELYEDTVKKGMWIWPVGTDGAVREFCMYCLLDVGRNYGE